MIASGNGGDGSMVSQRMAHVTDSGDNEQSIGSSEETRQATTMTDASDKQRNGNNKEMRNSHGKETVNKNKVCRTLNARN